MFVYSVLDNCFVRSNADPYAQTDSNYIEIKFCFGSPDCVRSANSLLKQSVEGSKPYQGGSFTYDVQSDIFLLRVSYSMLSVCI